MKLKLYYNMSFEFGYRVSSRRLRIKDFCKSETLIDQELHIALKMPTSETAHAEREREREHTCKIITRQSLSN
jgi:hypothetical protein